MNLSVLQINVVGRFGSTGIIADEIGELCISQGWQSYIAAGRKIRKSNSKIIKIGNQLDIIIHGIKSRIFDTEGFGSKNATLKLIKKIRYINPDIVHLHNLHGYYVNIEILFNFLSFFDKPVVWTLHDCWPFTGHCTYFDYIDCDKWKTQCYSCPQKNDYPSSYFLDNSKKNYVLKRHLFNSINNLTIVPVSKWLDGLLKDSFLSQIKRTVINNGIDLNIFKPLEINEKLKINLGLANKYVILGVASIWSKRKGFSDFIKLSRVIKENMIIVLVGLNSSHINKLPKNIIGIKRTDNVKELVDIYNISDIYLNLTYEDNFPTTNLEALACGTPVITYDTGGSVEALSAKTGYIVKKGDIKFLNQKLDSAFKLKKSSFKDHCRKRALKFFDKKNNYAKYINLYKKNIN